MADGPSGTLAAGERQSPASDTIQVTNQNGSASNPQCAVAELSRQASDTN